MEKALAWTRNGLAVLGIFALGFWLGAGRIVQASANDTGNGVQFQLAGVNESSSLLVYQPGTKTVYVYRGATVGNAALQCSYMFQLERPGAVIRRIPCDIPRLIP